MKLNTPTHTPEDFVQPWQNADANERQSYQEHFRDVCRLIGAVTPGVLIEDVATTAKTFPDFPTTWQDAVDTGGAQGGIWCVHGRRVARDGPPGHWKCGGRMPRFVYHPAT